MNLVIDDAVEVKQATKTEEESRRHLGTLRLSNAMGGLANMGYRTNITEG
jgi:hypothetical protein